jgi:hypothetical protein
VICGRSKLEKGEQRDRAYIQSILAVAVHSERGRLATVCTGSGTMLSMLDCSVEVLGLSGHSVEYWEVEYRDYVQCLLSPQDQRQSHMYSSHNYLHSKQL